MKTTRSKKIPALTIDIQNSRRSPWSRVKLRAILCRCLREMPEDLRTRLAPHPLALHVSFVTMPVMRQLNFRLRKKKRATDVLSLEFNEGWPRARNPLVPVGPVLLGEIFLCPDYLRHQAKAQGNLWSDEMLYLLIHGLLHILGYDHENQIDERQEMFSLQNHLFAKLRPKRRRHRQFHLLEEV